MAGMSKSAQATVAEKEAAAAAKKVVRQEHVKEQIARQEEEEAAARADMGQQVVGTGEPRSSSGHAGEEGDFGGDVSEGGESASGESAGGEGAEEEPHFDRRGRDAEELSRARAWKAALECVPAAQQPMFGAQPTNTVLWDTYRQLDSEADAAGPSNSTPWMSLTASKLRSWGTTSGKGKAVLPKGSLADALDVWAMAVSSTAGDQSGRASRVASHGIPATVENTELQERIDAILQVGMHVFNKIELMACKFNLLLFSILHIDMEIKTRLFCLAFCSPPSLSFSLIFPLPLALAPLFLSLFHSLSPPLSPSFPLPLLISLSLLLAMSLPPSLSLFLETSVWCFYFSPPPSLCLLRFLPALCYYAVPYHNALVIAGHSAV